eukprot:scaffold41025_cov39-Phaeocystis_antarctica.AAC.1
MTAPEFVRESQRDSQPLDTVQSAPRAGPRRGVSHPYVRAARPSEIACPRAAPPLALSRGAVSWRRRRPWPRCAAAPPLRRRARPPRWPPSLGTAR